MHELLFL